MEKEQLIKQLLLELRDNTNNITKLEEYDIKDIIDVSLKNGLFDSLLILFKPLLIDGEMRIPFDPFSTDLLSMLEKTYESKEETIQEAKEYYEESQRRKRELPGETYDDRTYEEILDSMIVFPSDLKRDFIRQLFTIDIDKINEMKIKNTHSRQIAGWNHPVFTPDDVILYAEPACLQSCMDLFNKNIKTTMNDTDGVFEDASTNKSGNCEIWIDYGLLSDENKEIIDELIFLGLARRFMDGKIDTISISVPCDGEKTVGEVSQKLQSIVSRFKMQDILYGRQTLERFCEEDLFEKGILYPDLYQKYFSTGECTRDDLIRFAEEVGYYYDPEEDLLWDDKRYYDRHRRYVQQQLLNNICESLENGHDYEMNYSIGENQYRAKFIAPTEDIPNPSILLIPLTGEINNQIIVEANNMETDNFKELVDEAATKAISLAKNTSSHPSPILIPILPGSKEGPYYQQLSVECFAVPEDKRNHRIDNQVVKMIDNAKKVCTEFGIEPEDKIFLNGYSASGVFAQRFSLLHPEIVETVCIGGASGSIPVPTDKFE